MLFLIRRIIFMVLLNAPLMAATNPFSITFETEKKSIEGEVTQVLKINVSSRSIEDAKYQLVVDIPKGQLAILEGKKVYNGILGPLKTDDFNLALKVSSEGEGEIKVRVYNYIDDREVDSQNYRIFYTKYTITKNPASSELFMTLSSANEKNEAEKAAEKNNTDIKQEDQITADANQQKFVVDPKNRYNGFIRVILFLLSFFVAGWLAYKIINRPL